MQIIGLTAGAVAVGAKVPFSVAECVPEKAIIRETVAFDMYRNRYVVRWDVTDGKTHLHVDAEVDENNINDRERYAAPMWHVLEDAMKHREMKVENLIPLERVRGAVVSRNIEKTMSA